MVRILFTANKKHKNYQFCQCLNIWFRYMCVREPASQPSQCLWITVLALKHKLDPLWGGFNVHVSTNNCHNKVSVALHQHVSRHSCLRESFLVSHLKIKGHNWKMKSLSMLLYTTIPSGLVILFSNSFIFFILFICIFFIYLLHSTRLKKY